MTGLLAGCLVASLLVWAVVYFFLTDAGKQVILPLVLGTAALMFASAAIGARVGERIALRRGGRS